MTIITQSGSTYTFKTYDNSVRVLYGSKEILVTDIQDMFVGNRMTVKGYGLDPYTMQPRTDCGKYFFTTSPIVKILP